MALNPQETVQIQIVGLITSVEYQKAIAIAKQLNHHFPSRFSYPCITGYLEFDWEEYILKQRRKNGKQYWKVKEPVLITTSDGFFGDCTAFAKKMSTTYKIASTEETLRYYESIVFDYLRYLRKSDRLYAFLDISIDERPIGSLLFELYTDLLPKTCENFRCLCTGEKGMNEDGIMLHYKDTLIHRIAKMGWIQGGDVENLYGGGGASIYGPTFPDESFSVAHDRRGVLSMANDGKHSNGSQFFITLQPASWMDAYYVAFGQLIEGVAVLESIENVVAPYEQPLQTIKIYNCGILDIYDDKEIVSSIEAAEELMGEEKFEATTSPTEKLSKNTIPQHEIESEYKAGVQFEEAPSPRSESIVMDPRQVPSFLKECYFLRGLYSLTLPGEVVDRALSRSETKLIEELTDFILSEGIHKIEEQEAFASAKSSGVRVAKGILKSIFDPKPIDIHNFVDEEFCINVAEEIVRLTHDAGSGTNDDHLISEIAEEIMRCMLLKSENAQIVHSKIFSISLASKIVKQYMHEEPLASILNSRLEEDETEILEKSKNVVAEIVKLTKEAVSISLSFVKKIIDDTVEK